MPSPGIEGRDEGIALGSRHGDTYSSSVSFCAISMAESLRSAKSTSETKMMPLSVEAMPAIMLKPAANEVESHFGQGADHGVGLFHGGLRDGKRRGFGRGDHHHDVAPGLPRGRNPAGSLRHTTKMTASTTAMNTPVRVTWRISVGVKAV